MSDGSKGRGTGKTGRRPDGDETKINVTTTLSRDVRAAQRASGRSIDSWLRQALGL